MTRTEQCTVGYGYDEHRTMGSSNASKVFAYCYTAAAAAACQLSKTWRRITANAVSCIYNTWQRRLRLYCCIAPPQWVGLLLSTASTLHLRAAAINR